MINWAITIIAIIHFVNFEIKYFFIIIKIWAITTFIRIIIIIILKIGFKLIDFKSNF